MTENEYFTFETGHSTDTGRVREHNEDSYQSLPDLGLWVVADGMGGHAAGDYASQTIAQESTSVGIATSLADLEGRFMERLVRAHDTIRAHAAALGSGTIGATVVSLLTFEKNYACIWSGDSRIYLSRGGHLVQQTRDHTEVQHLLDTGAINAEEAATWPRKNVITRAVGVSKAPQCDVVEGTLADGDVFLLCSDGLTEHVTDPEISDFLNKMRHGAQVQDVCDDMIETVLSRGAKDNVTCVVVRCAARGKEV